MIASINIRDLVPAMIRNSNFCAKVPKCDNVASRTTEQVAKVMVILSQRHSALAVLSYLIPPLAGLHSSL